MFRSYSLQVAEDIPSKMLLPLLTWRIPEGELGFNALCGYLCPHAVVQLDGITGASLVLEGFPVSYFQPAAVIVDRKGLWPLDCMC